MQKQIWNAYSVSSPSSTHFSFFSRCRTQRHSASMCFTVGGFFRRMAMCRSLDGNFGVLRTIFGWTWIAFGIIAPSIFLVGIFDAFKLFALVGELFSVPAGCFSSQSLNTMLSTVWFKRTLSKAIRILSSVIEGAFTIDTSPDLFIKRIFFRVRNSLRSKLHATHTNTEWLSFVCCWILITQVWVLNCSTKLKTKRTLINSQITQTRGTLWLCDALCNHYDFFKNDVKLFKMEPLNFYYGQIYACVIGIHVSW